MNWYLVTISLWKIFYIYRKIFIYLYCYCSYICVTFSWLVQRYFKILTCCFSNTILPWIEWIVKRNESIFAISGSMVLLNRSLQLSHSSRQIILLFPKDSLIAWDVCLKDTIGILLLQNLQTRLYLFISPI